MHTGKQQLRMCTVSNRSPLSSPPPPPPELFQPTQVFSGLSLLRKLCNHPDLMTTTTDGESGRRGVGRADGPPIRVRGVEGVGPHTAAGPLEEDEFGYWGKAGKMVVVQALLSLWKTQGHKVLVFTQGTQVSCAHTAHTHTHTLSHTHTHTSMCSITDVKYS